MTETWRAIPSWPGYEASDAGRVRNAKTGSIRKPSVNSDGYQYLSTGGVKRKVHQLVAEAFHGPRAEGAVTRHRDGNRQNNKPANLCYGTRSDNTQDAREHGTVFGIATSYQEAQTILRRFANGTPVEDLAASLGCTVSGLRRMLRRWREYVDPFESDEIEAKLGKLKRRPRASATVAQDAEAYRLRCSGLSLHEVGSELGYARFQAQSADKAVRRHCARHGLPVPRGRQDHGGE